MTNATDRDPRTVDADGFVIDAPSRPRGGGIFGKFDRPSVGGLGSTVAKGDRVGLIVGMGGQPELPEVGDGLALRVIWLSAHRTADAVPGNVRDAAWLAYDQGSVMAEWIPAEGLVALDAWMPAF